MRRTVIVMLDGLRRDFVSPELTPHLAALAERAERFAGYRSTFPSATRVVSSTMATGCYPARHELQGNTLVLLENGRLVRYDAGHPDFLQKKRHVTGRSLAVPTLAERLAGHGDAIIFNNVSPGAAYAHDPDGHGHVYHRAGSFGPGRVPVPGERQLNVTLDAAGDRAMTERFVIAALARPGPALALLWLGEPDHIQHNSPLGSPEHLAVLREADRNLGLVYRAVEALREAGDDVLLIAGSDHGHETVTGVVDIEDELVTAGFKSDADSGEIVVAANGTAALIYVHPDHAACLPGLEDFLNSRPWAGLVVGGESLATVGQAATNGLAFAVSLKGDDRPNEFGIPGSCLVAKPHGGKSDRLGCGQHGGLNIREQGPILLIDGPGFEAGTSRASPVAVVDIAPTILRHLRLPTEGMDGRPLQSSPVEDHS